jgi:4-hydroxy-3-methylbut-2-enyl diphosphate reductase
MGGMTEPVAAGAATPAPATPGAGRKVFLAAPRGYCAGVDRAVDTVSRALDLHGAPLYVRKEIVHNRYVVETFEKRGVIFVDETDDVPEGANVVFSAHGVSPAVRDRARSLDLRTFDATCPLVTKVHNEVRRFVKQGYQIVLIGHHGHEEVEGTAGEAPDAVHLVDGAADVDALSFDRDTKLVWLSQTTLSVDETVQTVRLLQERFPWIETPPSDDICYATQNRQIAVKAIAPQVDLMIVVGSENSSNSKRLVEVALQHGAGGAHLVDFAAQLDPAWFDGVQAVGVTSGASVPEILVEGVLDTLADLGFSDTDEITTATETTTFALPRELRPHRPAAAGDQSSRSRGRSAAR